MSSPAIKICGLTSPAQATACAELGVWAVGVVLVPGTPRAVDAERAREVLDPLPGSVARVGVVVDPDPATCGALVRAIGLTHLQVHGDVDPEAVRAAAGVPVIQAFGVDGVAALDAARDSAADLVLLDAKARGVHGGTGTRFAWDLVELRPLARPFVLAGGLRPENVADAVRIVGPTHVDVSSGVERSPGDKDLDRVASFVRAVHDGARRAA